MTLHPIHKRNRGLWWKRRIEAAAKRRLTSSRPEPEAGGVSATFKDPTAQECRELGEATGMGLREARRIILKQRIHSALTNAKTVEDLRLLLARTLLLVEA